MLVAWYAAGFFLGSCPLAIWVRRAFLDTDVRSYGDGNPGAVNLWRAGGWRWGTLGVVLELAKSAVPTTLAASWGGMRSWPLAAMALSPVLGHAFSPWLRFRGGKAIAAVFGAWLGLLGPVGMVALAVCLGLMHAWQTSDAWTVLLGMVAFLVYLVLCGEGLPMVGTWCGCTAVLILKHRHELRKPPALRGRLPARRHS